MENEETHIDENLKEAYNYGYLIGKHKPEIAESLQESYSKKPDMETPGIIAMLVEGINEGVKEIDKIQQNLKEIKSLRENKEQEIGLSPDILE